MYAKRVDSNHKQIMGILRELGATVFDLSRVGKGCPDLLVGYKGRSILVEVKANEKSKFTEHQLEFIANWGGDTVARIDSIDGAIRLIKTIDASVKSV